MAQFASERLAERCRDMAERDGLVDMKFVLAPGPDMTIEAVCEETLAMLDAHERGASVPLDFGDSMRLRDIP